MTRTEADGSVETDDALRTRRTLLTELWLAIRLTAALLFIAGIAYPAMLRAVTRVAFSRQAEGSLVYGADGRAVGSVLIGQAFARPEYFHGRPSVAGYGAEASSGSNIGPTNAQLFAGNGSSYAGVIAYATAYRRENGLGVNEALPSDAVTASGSGLDPQISPANAELQVARAAAARKPALSEVAVRALVRTHTERRTIGILGEPRVNLLLLNLALDSASDATRARP